MCDFDYLDIKLKLQDNKAAVVTADYFEASINSSLSSLFGEIGGVTDLELLEFDALAKRGIIRVASKFVTRVRAAITIIGHYQEVCCHFAILRSAKQPLNL